MEARLGWLAKEEKHQVGLRQPPPSDGGGEQAGLPFSLQRTDRSSRPASHLGKVTCSGLAASCPGAMTWSLPEMDEFRDFIYLLNTYMQCDP